MHIVRESIYILYIDETNLHCYTEFKHELKRDWFTSICCRRGTSGLGLCALENAISSGKQGDRQVWASTYMLLVDRTWKEEKARKRWSNACACYTLQGSSAKTLMTPCEVIHLTWLHVMIADDSMWGDSPHMTPCDDCRLFIRGD